jgi:cation diffusion facilitator family transporter
MHQLQEGQAWDPFPPMTTNHDDAAHRRRAHRALLISALGLSLTGVLELAVALLSGSVGLLGDAIHNLADVSTSLVAFVGFRVPRRPATSSRPYGHERAEDLAGLGVALVIWASAVFAGYASIQKLIHHRTTSHLAVGMAAAIVAIVGNQLVARYKRKVGTEIQSTTLLADAKHSWLDAVASGGALIGLIGVALGLQWADGVAGLLVTGFIIHVGWEVTSDVMTHLMDGIDPADLETAERASLAVTGVHHVHARGRWLGRTLLIEIDGFVDGGISVEHAESLGQRVRERITEVVPECRSVLWTPHSHLVSDGLGGRL